VMRRRDQTNGCQAAAERLVAVAEGGASCRAAGGLSDEASSALAVTPRRGRAVIFATRRPDGTVDPNSWHGGAALSPSETPGLGKWTMQKFKEIPAQATGRTTF
jgi:hypothetical protein